MVHYCIYRLLWIIIASAGSMVHYCIYRLLWVIVQRVMNCAARLVCKAPKREHVTLLLVDLRWLPVERRIKYKIVTIVTT